MDIQRINQHKANLMQLAKSSRVMTVVRMWKFGLREICKNY